MRCLLPLVAAVAGEWYDGIDSIRVFGPGDNPGPELWDLYNKMHDAQFSSERHAILLKSGTYSNLEIGVGYYTAIYGVGATDKDVKFSSFFTLDGKVGGATQNFWRSVEGVTVTNPSITWACSQACPVRRSTIEGEFWLSEPGPPHWSSGGYVSDLTVNGQVHVGTQQQFFFRNSEFGGGVDYTTGGWNFVFVGVEGAPTSSTTDKKYMVSNAQSAPIIAEKPYLVEENGSWSIAVPEAQTNLVGRAPAATRRIAMQDVFVARVGDTAATITEGIRGKKALLFTPGTYGLSEVITIDQTGFVVLGIGFPTLVPVATNSALLITAEGAHVAGLLLEAGTPKDAGETRPLLRWSGPKGSLSDIFARVGSFSYETDFKASCLVPRADVHVQIDGSEVTVDNTWLWHADHDDCGGKSDDAFSGHGFLVTGSDVRVHGLKVEHTMKDLVSWQGERGEVYFFQSELPYDDPEFAGVGYHVAPEVQQHTAMGVGVYIVGALTVATGVRVPPTASMTHVFAWCITGAETQFGSVMCTSEGSSQCYKGDQCVGSACYVGHVGETSVVV
uniref:Uncharacterized protein n=1 Tax=Oxyrrhis marina TaxID=2969 RepID=A0A7S4GL43_OXYMA|mmetsp:Transcript_12372/g.29465  ORF Transcript_12372/g.29465 Transcript_12372/m.29465 type:complete len:559 (-) Transcript_12372:440-2116(-)